MFYWGYWIGPLIAVVLALWLRPGHLTVLGLTALAGFVVSFSIAQRLYPDCEGDCPPGNDILSWVNGILFTIAPALLLLGLAKHVLYAWLRRHRAGSVLSAS
jgi:hypothetical protein